MLIPLFLHFQTKAPSLLRLCLATALLRLGRAARLEPFGPETCRRAQVESLMAERLADKSRRGLAMTCEKIFYETIDLGDGLIFY